MHLNGHIMLDAIVPTKLPTLSWTNSTTRIDTSKNSKKNPPPNIIFEHLVTINKYCAHCSCCVRRAAWSVQHSEHHWFDNCPRKHPPSNNSVCEAVVAENRDFRRALKIVIRPNSNVGRCRVLYVFIQYVFYNCRVATRGTLHRIGAARGLAKELDLNDRTRPLSDRLSDNEKVISALHVAQSRRIIISHGTKFRT